MLGYHMYFQNLFIDKVDKMREILILKIPGET